MKNTTFPLPFNCAATLCPPSRPASRLFVPIKYSRLLSGESESIVITGIPASIAASISGIINWEFATDTRIPAGFSATTDLNSSTSACGSKPFGPRISAVTPYSVAALSNPSAAVFQYGTPVFAAIR